MGKPSPGSLASSRTYRFESCNVLFTRVRSLKQFNCLPYNSGKMIRVVPYRRYLSENTSRQNVTNSWKRSRGQYTCELTQKKENKSISEGRKKVHPVKDGVVQHRNKLRGGFVRIVVDGAHGRGFGAAPRSIHPFRSWKTVIVGAVRGLSPQLFRSPPAPPGHQTISSVRLKSLREIGVSLRPAL